MFKRLEPTIDVGNLYIEDINILDNEICKRDSEREEYLLGIARENTQCLIHELWQLPTRRIDEAVIAELPKPTTVLPRAKPPPQPKKLTKWERYAALKGIQKKKKGRMAFDDNTQEWKPQWGYKRANDASSQWLLEVPSNAPDDADQFAKLQEKRRENVAKNDLAHMKNIARNLSKGSNSSAENKDAERRASTVKSQKLALRKALAVAQRSDASLGEFSAPVRQEVGKGKRKEKLAPRAGRPGGGGGGGVNNNLVADKQRQLRILKELEAGRSLVDSNRAANLHQIETEARNRAARGEVGPNASRKERRAAQRASGFVDTRAGKGERTKGRRANIRATKMKKYGSSMGGSGVGNKPKKARLRTPKKR